LFCGILHYYGLPFDRLRANGARGVARSAIWG
jgi:hypothetical protein